MHLFSLCSLKKHPHVRTSGAYIHTHTHPHKQTRTYPTYYTEHAHLGQPIPGQHTYMYTNTHTHCTDDKPSAVKQCHHNVQETKPVRNHL